jgi:cell division GTPase FtsZ
MKKNILLIGVGGTGSKAVDIFFQKCKELGN